MNHVNNMTKEDIIEIFNHNHIHEWLLQYIQDGKLKTSWTRGRTISEAIMWLDYVTDNKAQIVGCIECDVKEALNQNWG